MSKTPGIAIDCDFPGGNIIVGRIEGDRIELRQDLRDTEGFWFYWAFRVRGAGGRTLRFSFPQEDVFGALGPAVSTDRGQSWRWLGAEAMEGTTFTYSFPPDADEVRFCVSIPYMETNLRRFLARFEGDSHLETGVLCKTKKGRPVERLRLGRLDGKAEHRILITCRHHCCEAMANYAAEGIMESVLAESDDGQWFREQAEFLVIPFVDKDGVEDGDQGKDRRPHDHNRDYHGRSIYPSVRAIRRFVPDWAEGRLRLALDMHCLYIKDRNAYFVGTPEKANWERLCKFSEIFDSLQTAPAILLPKHNISWHRPWDANQGPPRSATRWAGTLEGIGLAMTSELPYAVSNKVAITPERVRTFGRDLARTIRRYLQAEH